MSQVRLGGSMCWCRLGRLGPLTRDVRAAPASLTLLVIG